MKKLIINIFHWLFNTNWIELQEWFWLFSFVCFNQLKCAAHPWYDSHINGVATQCHRNRWNHTNNILSLMSNFSHRLCLFIFLLFLSSWSACDIFMTHKKYQKSFSIWINMNKRFMKIISMTFFPALDELQDEQKV